MRRAAREGPLLPPTPGPEDPSALPAAASSPGPGPGESTCTMPGEAGSLTCVPRRGARQARGEEAHGRAGAEPGGHPGTERVPAACPPSTGLAREKQEASQCRGVQGPTLKEGQGSSRWARWVTVPPGAEPPGCCAQGGGWRVWSPCVGTVGKDHGSDSQAAGQRT